MWCPSVKCLILLIFLCLYWQFIPKTDYFSFNHLVLSITNYIQVLSVGSSCKTHLYYVIKRLLFFFWRSLPFDGNTLSIYLFGIVDDTDVTWDEKSYWKELKNSWLINQFVNGSQVNIVVSPFWRMKPFCDLICTLLTSCIIFSIWFLSYSY